MKIRGKVGFLGGYPGFFHVDPMRLCASWAGTRRGVLYSVGVSNRRSAVKGTLLAAVLVWVMVLVLGSGVEGAERGKSIFDEDWTPPATVEVRRPRVERVGEPAAEGRPVEGAAKGTAGTGRSKGNVGDPNV